MERLLNYQSQWEAARRANNFDNIRLLAAFLVIFSHSYEIAGGPDAAEPLRAMTDGQMSFGRLAVLMFFILSGFLLAHSWQAERALVPFAIKRALRIFPALGAVVLISLFALGPILTDKTLTDYFGSGESWAYLANLGFYTKNATLPGVFDGLPYSGVINGPLWTLKFEIICYIAIAAAGCVRLFRPAGVIAAIVALYFAQAYLGEGPHAGLAYYLEGAADLGRSFFAGALFAVAGRQIRFSAWGALACAVVIGLSVPAGLLNDVFPVFGAYALLWVGLNHRLTVPRLTGKNDYSYGLYLWGWPAQQIVQQFLPEATWGLNFLLAAPLALIAAIASWHALEKPALQLKGRVAALSLRAGRAPIPTPKAQS